MVTASNSVSDVVNALKGGATDYVTKPVDDQRLMVSLTNALKMLRQQQDLDNFRSELSETYKLEHMIGRTPAMEKVRELIRQSAPSDATVLILERAARARSLLPGRCIIRARVSISLSSTSTSPRSPKP